MLWGNWHNSLFTNNIDSKILFVARSVLRAGGGPKIHRKVADCFYLKVLHCVKSVRIRSFSGPYSVQMRENTDLKNSEYGQFSCSAKTS